MQNFDLLHTLLLGWPILSVLLVFSIVDAEVIFLLSERFRTAGRFLYREFTSFIIFNLRSK